MYEALRVLETTSPEGRVIQIAPGEVVIGFESWPLRNQIAAINQHMVRSKAPGVPLSARLNETQLREERERLYEAAARRENGDQMRTAGRPEQKEAPIVPEAENALACDQCDYTTHSQQGLKTHRARKHKG